MKIKICSDSTCDLSPALIEEYDITIAPLTVSMGSGSYHDGIDITPEDIFAHVDGGGEHWRIRGPVLPFRFQL